MNSQPGMPSRQSEPLAIRIAWPIAALFTVIIPLWVSRGGSDQFRVPKLSLFRAEGILLGALLILGAIHYTAEVRSRWKTASGALLLPLLILGWTVVVTCASEERRVSAASLVTVAAGAAIFFVVYDRGRYHSPKVAWAIFIPALVNAVAIFVEMRPEWDLRFARALMGGVVAKLHQRVTPTGFMGNRDDLADMLVPAAIVALAIAVMPAATQLARIVAATLIIALVATQTLTAIVAFIAAAVVMGFLRSWRSGLVTALVIVAALPVAFYAHPGMRSRVRKMWNHLNARSFDAVVVGRVAPNMAALAMISDHPIAGVGPGLFGKNYGPYRSEAARRYPSLVSARWGREDYFIDAHDDHLQVAAEGGMVAYLLFLATMGAGVSFSLRRSARDSPSPKQQLGRMAAAPLFVGLFVLAVAHFPLQLAGTLQAWIVSAGLVAGWSDDASA